MDDLNLKLVFFCPQFTFKRCCLGVFENVVQHFIHDAVDSEFLGMVKFRLFIHLVKEVRFDLAAHVE